MRSVFINLARAPGRRAFMTDQAARLGLPLLRIDAVDGRTIPTTEYDRLCPVPAAGRRIARSELACFLSHIEAWRGLAASAAPYAAVFEDDVFLADDVAAFLGETGWIPPDADLVRLSSSAVRLKLRAEPALEKDGRRVRRLLAGTVDTGGYIIAAGYARRLLARPERFAAPVDRILLDPSGGAVIYQLDPSLAVQAKWADFAFLSADEARSQVQTEKPPRVRSGLSLAKIPRELDALRRKVLLPTVLPLLQRFRPKSERVLMVPVAFRK